MVPGLCSFSEILQNVSERQILWSLCSVIFHALKLKFPIQTSLSVAPKLSVPLHSGEKCENSGKREHPRFLRRRDRQSSGWGGGVYEILQKFPKSRMKSRKFRSIPLLSFC